MSDREEFEAAMAPMPCNRDRDGNYTDSGVRLAYRAWQAARATPAEPDADVRNRVVEECARFVEHGSFFHSESPIAKFARECAAEMRKQMMVARNGTEAT